MSHPFFTPTTLKNNPSSVMDIFQKMVQIVEEKNQNEQLVLTVKDAAAELQVSIPTLRDHFLCRPDFPKIRAGSKILIPRKALRKGLTVKTKVKWISLSVRG